MRGKTLPRFYDVDGGIEAALAVDGMPVVMADPADNAGAAPRRTTRHPAPADRAPGGQCRPGPDLGPDRGAPLLRRRSQRELALRFGGKIGPASGRPVDAQVTVIGLKQDAWQSFGPTQVPLGDCAAVRLGGIEVVLISNRTQALGLELFRNVGIEPLAKKLLVVKSTNHFMGNFGPIANR